VRAGVAFAVLAFAPALLDPFAPLKAAGLLAIGAALAVDAFARGDRAHDAPARAALVALLVVALSAAVAPSGTLALFGEIEQREGLATWAALVAVFFGARAAHADAAARSRTLDVALAAATIAAAYALAQFAGFDAFAWGDAARYAHAGAVTLRPAATLGNPILLGAVLAPALAIAAARLASGRGDRVVLAASAALLGCAIAATLSRGAMLAAFAGVACAIAASRAPRARALVALACAAGPALAWSAFALRAAPLARFAEGASASSSPARLEIARAALALWRERPWFGQGPDGFGLAFPRVQTPEYWRHVWLGTPAHAHGAPLQLLATLGVLGVLAMAVWAVCALAPLVRAMRSPHAGESRAEEAGALAALAVAALFNPLGLAGAVWAVVLLGMAAGAPAAVARRWPATSARAAAVAAALAVAIAFVPGLRALAEAGRARAALEQSVGAPPEQRVALAEFAARSADASLAAAGFDDAPWRLAADAHLAAARASGTDRAKAQAHAEAAEREARAAIALRPARAMNHLRLAQALSARGEAPDSAFATAERLAPSDALVRAEHARAALARGDFATAREQARRIVAMYPEAALGHALEASAALVEGREADALAALRRALAAEWEDGAGSQRAAARALEARLAASADSLHR
jgi:O-antigen ligase